MERKQISHTANQWILQPIETTAVMQRLQIDLIDYSKSPLQKFNDNMNYILTCIGYFSKFIWAFSLKNKSTNVVANALHNLFCWEGRWNILMSHRGPEFQESVIIICDRWGIKKVQSLPYSSNTNRQVERANLIIRQATTKYMAENSTKKFAGALPSLIYVYDTKK